MRIICISDTHNKHDELTNDLLAIKGDNEKTILIHAGDISGKGTLTEISNFLNWFSNLPFKYKVFIAGNHDFGFEMSDTIADEFIEKGVIYLFDRMIEIEGIKIYGSPWQPRFYDWAFNVNRGEAIAKKWEKIPEGLDILVTHGPAFGILDLTYGGIRAGCEDLYMKIFEVKPKHHICGHIHFGYGMRIMDDTTFINAASLGEGYEYDNKPIVFHINN